MERQGLKFRMGSNSGLKFIKLRTMVLKVYQIRVSNLPKALRGHDTISLKNIKATVDGSNRKASTLRIL